VLSHKKFLTNNSVLLPQRATHEKSGVGEEWNSFGLFLQLF